MLTDSKRGHGLRHLSLLLICTTLVLGACGNDDAPVSPGVEPEVVNTTDNFQFQVTDVRNYTGTWDYPWSNSGEMAVVDHSSSVTEGEATLSIRDAYGTEVYSRDLADDGSFQSTSGETGNWTIQVDLSAASGTFNFRVDKATP